MPDTDKIKRKAQYCTEHRMSEGFGSSSKTTSETHAQMHLGILYNKNYTQGADEEHEVPVFKGYLFSYPNETTRLDDLMYSNVASRIIPLTMYDSSKLPYNISEQTKSSAKWETSMLKISQSLLFDIHA